MARKVTSLPVASTVAGTDLLLVTTDPSGTPTSQQVTLATAVGDVVNLVEDPPGSGLYMLTFG